MADFINTIDVLGDDAVVDSIIDRTITEFKDDTITSIGYSAFYGCKNLVSVDAPNVSDVLNQAFFGCSSLTDVNLPNVVKLYGGTFRTSGLREADFPKCTTISAHEFYGCPSLTRVSLPLIENLQYQCLNGCSALTEVYAPSATTIGYAAVRDDTLIKRLDFPAATLIEQYCMHGCTSLDTLILRNTASVVTSADVNMLGNTPIANGTGYIYVPRALVDSYKSATNWSTFATQFRALEDYTVDGTTTGELDETKI